ncbi:MAG: shikimate kinase [Gammaproteobacteria bacterium]
MAKTLENIVLVGPMGSGKTTVGRRLADELGCDFYDSDHEIIDKTGVSVEHIFDIEGEKGFRDRESQMLCELYQKSGAIIATGGGIVLRPENRALLQQSGIVVYLASSIEQLLKRTSKSKNRPILEKSLDREKTIRDILNARESYYREVSVLEIDTTGKQLHEVIDTIKQYVQNSK